MLKFHPFLFALLSFPVCCMERSSIVDTSHIMPERFDHAWFSRLNINNKWFDTYALCTKKDRNEIYPWQKNNFGHWIKKTSHDMTPLQKQLWEDFNKGALEIDRIPHVNINDVFPARKDKLDTYHPLLSLLKIFQGYRGWLELSDKKTKSINFFEQYAATDSSFNLTKRNGNLESLIITSPFLDCLKINSDKGSFFDQYLLAMFYLFESQKEEITQGTTTFRDHHKFYIKKSAQNGYAPAQWLLCLYYDDCRHQVLNSKKYRYNQKIFFWLNQAAFQGYIPAQMELGAHYYTHRLLGLSKEWYKRAAKQNNFEACKKVGCLYAFEVWNESKENSNHKKAIYWLTKAAQHDLSDAQELLIDYYAPSQRSHISLLSLHNNEKAIYWLFRYLKDTTHSSYIDAFTQFVTLKGNIPKYLEKELLTQKTALQRLKKQTKILFNKIRNEKNSKQIQKKQQLLNQILDKLINLKDTETLNQTKRFIAFMVPSNRVLLHRSITPSKEYIKKYFFHSHNPIKFYSIGEEAVELSNQLFKLYSSLSLLGCQSSAQKVALQDLQNKLLFLLIDKEGILWSHLLLKQYPFLKHPFPSNENEGENGYETDTDTRS